MVINKTILLNTKGNCDIIDITKEVANVVNNQEATDGIVVLFVPGATGALTTIEYESGLIEDLNDFLNSIIPSEKNYKHNQRWHDGNGHSHLRASLIGPSLSIPFNNKMLSLGTWQQIIFIDFDTRARQRKIILQIVA